MEATLAEDVEEILAEVAETYLHAPVALAPPGRSFDGEELIWDATVSIRGGWNGRVTLQCTEAFAFEMAQQMCAVDVDKETAVSALAEMANMVGGNLKSALAFDADKPCVLSTPVVTQNAEIHDGARSQLTFDCGDAMILIQVVGAGE